MNDCVWWASNVAGPVVDGPFEAGSHAPRARCVASAEFVRPCGLRVAPSPRQALIYCRSTIIAGTDRSATVRT